MRNPVNHRRHKDKLQNSNFGEFEATIKSTDEYYEFASVSIRCCNYKYHNKIIEAVQPVLDELKIEMVDLLKESDDGEDK